MFRWLGRFAMRTWPLQIGGWLLAAVVLTILAPPWDTVTEDGEFAFLPKDSPSRIGEELYRNAFLKSRSGSTDRDQDLLGSSIVVVVRRHGEPILDEDKKFIDEVLKPRIEQIARDEGGFARRRHDDEPEPAAEGSEAGGTSAARGGPQRRSVISNVRTHSDKSIGALLVSEDGQATLVIVELAAEFYEKRSREAVGKIEKLLESLFEEKAYEAGLALQVSGISVVGRDMKDAERESAKATETATTVLVIVVLLIIYRSPVLALIPLLTVGVAVHLGLKILAIMAAQGWIGLFAGIEVYVMVVVYGSGVDYCLFLVARYKEELDRGASFSEALETSIWKVGAALAASAGTTMAGIGMMVFARFGKFQYAGVAMSMSLGIVLLASVTFTPACLRLFGRWAFWPKMPTERVAGASGWIPSSSLVGRLLASTWIRGLWDRAADIVVRRPGTAWTVTVAAMFPFAVVGIALHDHLSYGLLTELAADSPSVTGTAAVQAHFPAGATGPVTLLVENRNVDFAAEKVFEDEPVDPDRPAPGIDLIREWTKRLAAHREELGIADVRSVAEPLGITPQARGAEDAGPRGALQRNARRKGAVEYYVGDNGEWAGHVTKVDVVFENDPFSRYSIAALDRFEKAAAELLPDGLRQGTTIRYVGATPSIRDLKHTTDGDQIRIDVLVVLVVFAILVVLLRRVTLSAYLIAGVYFTYLVTLGATFAVFWIADPEGFAGLDWKVPIFLFTILIAVGEDYSIYLLTRIDEEQRVHGPIDGIVVAMERTGNIVSSCGLIVAGTFATLMVGTLVGMKQLGFALAFGVVLDTFVVRPILVPAYLVMLHRGRFGALGRFLGAGELATLEVAGRLRANPEK